MQIAREVIAVLSPRPPLLEVVGGDHHDALIVPIALQQLSRKAKERRVRDAVVLDDDAFFDMLEEPGDGLADRILATQIARSEQGAHIAVPIHGRGELAYLRDALRVRCFLRSRSVHGKKNLRRPDRTQCLEDSRGRVRAIESEEQDGSAIFHATPPRVTCP